MISKEGLGTRIREVRKARNLTLKELERISGFSATHISEIERGKTSPTIGALMRIAAALGKETSFFLEEEDLSEVAITRTAGRQPLPEEVSKVPGDYLTPGISGGRVNAYMLYLDPGDTREVEYEAHGGEEGVYVISGQVQFRVGEREFFLAPGDALHYPADRPHGMKNLGEGRAELLMVSTKRVRRERSSNGTTGRTF